MASYDELAKQNPNSAAQSAFRFLAGGSAGFHNAAQLDYYTQALNMTVQHLVAWGLSGHKPSLKAYQGLVKVLPSSPYQVSLSSGELYKMGDWIDDVPRKLMKTKGELERDIQRLKSDLRRVQSDPIHRIAAMDIRERISGHEHVIKDFNERQRQWSVEAPKLKMRNAKPPK
ncbi:MAG: hypothetical protein JKY65_13965 [Planctomycetes bacterium]|nr:hypothetical protein [Planctomycetota bacterium]